MEFREVGEMPVSTQGDFYKRKVAIDAALGLVREREDVLFRMKLEEVSDSDLGWVFHGVQEEFKGALGKRTHKLYLKLFCQELMRRYPGSWKTLRHLVVSGASSGGDDEAG
jgi:hypothetical protein